MVTAKAVIHGNRDLLLRFHPDEYPVAVQLGGSDPDELGQAAAIVSEYGYDEVNLNCGCPSDRVQSGAFGAILMRSPDLVAACVQAMQANTKAEVTVKCRIGVDDQNPHDILPIFLDKLTAAGVKRVTIHARKAWLQGLSPKENRDIPPLDYDLVYAMKRIFPDVHISVNGGVADLASAKMHLKNGMDGVMIGRAAYHSPDIILGPADTVIFGQPGPEKNAVETVHKMLSYIDNHLVQGGRLHQVTRHMLGLFGGQPGARGWRRYLSEHASRPEAGPEVVEKALEFIIKEIP